MRCPFCIHEGRLSELYGGGLALIDDQDPTYEIIHYDCGRGHHFSVRRKRRTYVTR